jgi:hypothetical protein
MLKINQNASGSKTCTCPLLRHEVVLYNCFTVGYSWLIKPAVPSAVSYRSIGCMVQPLSGEASGKQYQTLARVA